MKVAVRSGGYVLILGGALLFGLLERPEEMGLAIVAGAIALVFVDIDRFRRIRGPGLDLELRDKIEGVHRCHTAHS